MKKSFLIFLIILLILFIHFKSFSSNPYKGKYTYERNNSVTLELINDEKFLIINTRNRSVDYISGKYSIDNNKIVLNSVKNKSSIFKEDKLQGKIEGEKITFYNSNQNETYIFIKS